MEESNKHYIKVVYEDSTRTITQSIVEIIEYDKSRSYRINVERCLEEIYEVGGLWINEEVIIPYSRIYSVSKYIAKEASPVKPVKKDRRINRRRKNRNNKPDFNNKPQNSNVSSTPSSGIINL